MADKKDTMKVRDLVQILQGKNQDEDVEYIVCTPKGEIIAMWVSKTAGMITKALKLFKSA